MDQVQPDNGSETNQGAKAGETKNLPATRLSSLPAEDLKSILDAAIESYGNGASIYAIALDLGVEHTTLYRHLIRHREGEWRDAKIGRALAELDEAEGDLKTAPDGLALSRARERCRAAQWQLERLMRRVYGQDHQADNSGRVSITLNIGAEKPRRVIDIDGSDHNP